MFDFSVLQYGLIFFLKGTLATLAYCTVAAAFGLAFGTIVALGRLSRRSVLRGLAAIFIEPFRDTPFLVQAFLIYFGLAQMGIRLSASFAGVVILSLYATANFAEAIRGGSLSVPRGQLEAARAVGMPYLVGMRRIVFPQAVGYLIPVITNLVIGLIKDSAALSVITVPELAMAAQQVVGDTFRPVETYLITAVIYWVMTTTVAGLIRQFQHHLVRRQAGLVRSMSLSAAAQSYPHVEQDR
jgi:His/Glu/Gln/Arg/opine family amino acid ABC transporter permease subunit